MPGSNKKFTDRDLTWLYGNLLEHYSQIAPFHDINSVYTQMLVSVNATLYSDYGLFKDLAPDEKAKVLTAFNTIFRALPIFRQLDPVQQNTFAPMLRATSPVVHVHHYNNNSRLYDWVLLNSLLHNCNHHGYYPSHRYPGRAPGGIGISSHTHHNHKEKSSAAELLVLLAIVALAASVAVFTCIALYYMFSEFLNSAERFYYNEGWLKAALMMASSLTFAASSFLATITFASMPIMILAVAAGLNPAGIMITSIVFLTIIGAGIGMFAMDLLYDSIDKKLNKNSMDPADPLRFRLTDAEEQKLSERGLDPINVKCALVALRSEIAKLLNDSDSSNSKPVPSFLNRHFGEGRKVQGLLQQVRSLRSGALESVTVGNLVIDCRTADLYQQSAYSLHQNQYAYVPDTFYTPPPGFSAPPPYAPQPSNDASYDYASYPNNLSSVAPAPGYW